MRRVLKLEFRSLLHRKKEIVRSCLTVCLAMFFIAGVLLLQENIFQWQMSKNKERFGDWFIRESASNNEPSEDLTSNLYLEEPSYYKKAVTVYDSDWERTTTTIGSFSEELIRQGNLTLDQGKWPESESEVVMDYNTLIQNGYDLTLGQSITLRYYIDDSNTKESGMRETTFTLCGIANNFSNVWESGDSLPTYIVSEDCVNAIQKKPSTSYFYALKAYVRTSDYENLYQKMVEPIKKKCIYNDYVYNYKPWGSSFIYNYMYILVMLIGISAITYQIWGYQKSRIISYRKMRRIGATKHQINMNILFENLLILLPAEIIGVALACVAGTLIGHGIGAHSGMQFFVIGTDVLAKSALSMVITILIQEVFCHYIIFRQIEHRLSIDSIAVHKSSRKKIHNPVKHALSCINYKNVNSQLHIRFVRENGIGTNIAVRVLTVLIALILVVCGWNIWSALQAYNNNTKSPDIVGYVVDPDQDISYQFNVFCRLPVEFNSEQALKGDKGELALQKEEKDRYTYDYYMSCKIDPTSELLTELREDYINQETTKSGSDYFITDQAISFAGSTKCKDADTSIYYGITDQMLSTIKQMSGVDTTTLSTIDTSRTLIWDNQDLDSMGGEELSATGLVGMQNINNNGYGGRYLFVSQYMEPTEEIYKRLCNYTDQLNYQDFIDGKQVIVLLQDTPDGSYDETLQQGDEITVSYNKFFDMEVQDMYPYDGYYQFLLTNISSFSKYTEAFISRFSDMSSVNSLMEDKDTRGRYYDYLYEKKFGGCAKTEAAAVIRVTDEMKEELSDLIIDYGQYTMIASNQLENTIYENQKSLMQEQADILDVEVPEEGYATQKTNQIAITYNLSSTFSSTDNIIQSILKSNNFNYVSYSSEKETVRTKTLNSILQYGITLIAAVVVDLLVCVILVKNRLAARRQKLLLLIHIGVDKSKLRKVCCLEIVRESLWCIFTAPLKILVEYVMYRNNIKQL